MKKLFVILALLLAGGAASASAETLVIVCPDGFVTRIEIPDRENFPSNESYIAYIQTQTATVCGLDLDYVKDHWDKYDFGEL